MTAPPPHRVPVDAWWHDRAMTDTGLTAEAPGVITERCTAQLLSGPRARRAVDVAERLLAVQGQDLRGLRLAVRARTEGLFAADVDQALTADRSLLVTWLNRGTLHLVRTADYWWLHQLTTPPLLTGNARRLRQEGVFPDAADRGVRAIEHSLAQEGPLTRQQLRDRISAAGGRTEGQALVHILALAALRGICVRGPMIGNKQAYVLVRDWLGAPPGPMDRDQALAMLARRYLAGHGPATVRDLARWVGLPLSDAKRGLTAIASELGERDDGLAAPAGQPAGAQIPPPRLLGAFDPLLLGWESRQPILGSREASVIRGGVFRPFALVRGRAAATWSITRGQVEISPFGRLAAADAAALAAEASDVERFLRGPDPASHG
jgi:hypothetical protein